MGMAAELVEHGHTGLRFRPGDPEDLAVQVGWFLSHPEEHTRMRREVRAEYEAKYTAQSNHQMLLGIYESALERKEAPA
jgi:glycosyltransferase involved in cell wall biosynthesis